MRRARSASLDDVDRKLLTVLQQDASPSLSALGERVSLSASAVQRRIDRLRSSHIISKQVAVLSDAALPGAVRACVLVALERESIKLHSGFQDRICAAAEVQQCYDLAGPWDYLVIVVADGMPACRAVIERLFLEAPNIKRYETHFVFESVKVGLEIPLRPVRRGRE
jgi:Lrp/AsnC family transcriptional regulator, leucine-responsive regulatory protein